jgi:hypothetical protein
MLEIKNKLSHLQFYCQLVGNVSYVLEWEEITFHCQNLVPSHNIVMICMQWKLDPLMVVGVVLES